MDLCTLMYAAAEQVRTGVINEAEVCSEFDLGNGQIQSVTITFRRYDVEHIEAAQ